MNADLIVRLVGGLIGSYLIGSIPASYLVAFYGHGVDPRTVGSGNVGATNVYRAVGARAGLVAAVLDIAKGTAAVLLARYLLPGGGPLGPQGFALACGAAAVVGHTYTVFLGFAGGKGVATGAGVFLAVAPGPLGASFAVFVVTIALTRYVSLGSILAAASLPVWVALFGPEGKIPILTISIAMALFIVIKHRSNIARIQAGTESRIGASSPRPDDHAADRPAGV